MNKKRCIIIDDERLARVILRDMISKISNIEIIDECANATSAKESIEQQKPHFILLDIKMPGKNGFELLEDLDYLLKPIKEEDLKNALDKIVVPQSDSSIEMLPPQIFIKDGDNCHFIKLANVIQFISFGNYVKIQTEEKFVLAKRSLNEIENRTSRSKYFRANRTHLFNIDMIKDVHVIQKGKIKILLKNDQEVFLSERKSARFKEMMGI